MKYIAVPILLLVVLVQSFAKWAIVLEWELNQHFIAKELCENKVKPALKCGGKCQLVKSLEQENKHNSQGTPEKASGITLLFSEELANLPLCAPEAIQLHHTDRYRFASYTAPASAIFHPPAA